MPTTPTQNTPNAFGPYTSVADEVWDLITITAAQIIKNEPMLTPVIRRNVLDRKDMRASLSAVLSDHSSAEAVSSDELYRLFADIHAKTPHLIEDAATDLMSVMEFDPAAVDIIQPFLFFKGFHALQTHRIAHQLWNSGQKNTALYLQSRSSLLYGVDIHPAARVGRGIMLDHATGIVIGETSVIEDNVNLYHGVTLGGTGKERQDRHPKLRKGAMVGAGATLLGNIEIGAGARVAAGSMVLIDVPAGATAAGVPAQIVRT